MEIKYVIEDVTSPGSFWNGEYRQFKGWLYADKFNNYVDAYLAIENDNVGVCKITKIYDSK